MDSQDIRTLKILQEIDGNQVPSQRYLSNKLNISLGLVNSFLRRLAQKGYLKATTIPKNRMKYILTPKGIFEKSRLTYEYVQYSFQFYRDARKKLRKMLKRLDENDTSKIVFYGVGDLAEIAYISLQETSIKLLAIIDEDNYAKPFLKFKIQRPETIYKFPYDKVLITTLDTDGTHYEKLLQVGVKEENILTFQ